MQISYGVRKEGQDREGSQTPTKAPETTNTAQEEVKQY